MITNFASMIRDGLEARDFRSTLRLYLLAVAGLAPVGLLIGCIGDVDAAFASIPYLVGGAVGILYAIRYRAVFDPVAAYLRRRETLGNLIVLGGGIALAAAVAVAVLPSLIPQRSAPSVEHLGGRTPLKGIAPTMHVWPDSFPGLVLLDPPELPHVPNPPFSTDDPIVKLLLPEIFYHGADSMFPANNGNSRDTIHDAPSPVGTSLKPFVVNIPSQEKKLAPLVINATPLEPPQPLVSKIETSTFGKLLVAADLHGQSSQELFRISDAAIALLPLKARNSPPQIAILTFDRRHPVREITARVDVTGINQKPIRTLVTKVTGRSMLGTPLEIDLYHDPVLLNGKLANATITTTKNRFAVNIQDRPPE